MAETAVPRSNLISNWADFFSQLAESADPGTHVSKRETFLAIAKMMREREAPPLEADLPHLDDAPIPLEEECPLGLCETDRQTAREALWTLWPTDASRPVSPFDIDALTILLRRVRADERAKIILKKDLTPKVQEVMEVAWEGFPGIRTLPDEDPPFLDIGFAHDGIGLTYWDGYEDGLDKAAAACASAHEFKAHLIINDLPRRPTVDDLHLEVESIHPGTMLTEGDGYGPQG